MKRNNLTAMLVITSALLAGCSQDQSTPPSVAPDQTTAAPHTAPAPEPKSALVASLASVPEWAPAAELDDQLSCYADTLNGIGGAAEGEVRSVASTDGFALLGWAVDKSLPAGSPQPKVLVQLSPQAGGDGYFFEAKRHDRPDVTASPVFASLQPKEAGVLVDASLQDVKPGMYQLKYVVGEGTAAKACTLGAPWLISVAAS